MLLLQLFLVRAMIRRAIFFFVPDTCANLSQLIITTSHDMQIVHFSYSLVGEVFDVLGDKQNVAFDDLAKLHQLGLVTCLFKRILRKKLSTRGIKRRGIL